MRDHQDIVDLVWRLPMEERLPLLVLSVIECNHASTVNIVRGLLAVIEAMSARDSAQRRCKISNLCRDSADVIEQPLRLVVAPTSD